MRFGNSSHTCTQSPLKLTRFRFWLILGRFEMLVIIMSLNQENLVVYFLVSCPKHSEQRIFMFYERNFQWICFINPEVVIQKINSHWILGNFKNDWGASDKSEILIIYRKILLWTLQTWHEFKKMPQMPNNFLSCQVYNTLCHVYSTTGRKQCHT